MAISRWSKCHYCGQSNECVKKCYTAIKKAVGGGDAIPKFAGGRGTNTKNQE